MKWDTGAGCVYYDNDTATYGIYGEDRGLLFNRSCILVINNWLQNNGFEGWRVATYDDFIALVNIAGGINTQTALQKLAKPQYWPNTTGITDELGFGMMPTGRVRSGEFSDPDGAHLLTDTVDNYSIVGQSDSNVQKVYAGSIGTWYDYGAIRLVKDEHGTIPATYKYCGLVHVTANQSDYGFRLPMNRPDNSITLEVKIRVTDGLADSRMFFIRKYSDTANQDYITTWTGQYTTLARNHIYFDYNGVNLSSEVGKIVDVSYGKDNFTWGANSYSFSGPSNPLDSISIGSKGMGNGSIGMDIFGATVKDGNGNVIGNYIPVTRISDSVAGLYDSMTDTFVAAS